MKKGFFPENTLTAKDADTVQLFAEGEAAFLIDGSWKVGHFVDNYADQLEDYAISYVPAKGERKATEALGGISMGYFITKKAWDDPAKQAAAVAFVEHMTSDEIMSTFVTTEVTALKKRCISGRPEQSPAVCCRCKQQYYRHHRRCTGYDHK